MILHKGKNCGFTQASAPILKYNSSASGKKQTIFFTNPPRIAAGASVVTEREANGPIGKYFDIIEHDPKMGEKCFETAEINMMDMAVRKAAEKAGKPIKTFDAFLGGDLLNQITTSAYVARGLEIPFLGMYNACSTFTETLAMGSALISAGHYDSVLCSTVSHFATAERQYRFPLEYGSQRPPYAQWTVTGAGCSALTKDGDGPRIVAATIGRVVDFGINDLSNMGAAMAPAAMDSMTRLFKDTGTEPEDYDLILTGDLGKLGSDILRDLMREQGYELGQRYIDCGSLIYDVTQKCYQGGSGAGCSSTVFNSYILEKIKSGEYNRVVLFATGALMSTQSCYQGETIPSVSHAVIIER